MSKPKTVVEKWFKQRKGSKAEDIIGRPGKGGLAVRTGVKAGEVRADLPQYKTGDVNLSDLAL